MAKGVTIDLIVDPKGAVDGLNVASGEAKKSTELLKDLGKIGAGAVAAVATAAVAAAGALAATTVSAGKYADGILEASTNTNISTDTLQAYKYAAEQMDVSFDTFISSQGKFTKSMAGATEGTGPAAEAFSALGLSVTDSAGNLVNSEDLYWQAVDALGQVSNETERTALAQQLFGKSGAEMNSIIAKGSAGFAELSAQAQANGAIMSGSQLDALGAFDDKMEALKSTVDAAKNALGLTLLPILDELAGSGTSALGQFSSALLAADGDLSKAGPAFEMLGTNVATALTTAVPKILEVGSSLIFGLITGIVTQGPTLIQTAIPLLLNFVTGILGMLPSIINAGAKILVALVSGVADSLPKLIPSLVTAILTSITTLFAPQNLTAILNAGLSLVTGLLTGILTALPLLIGRLPDIIMGIVTFLTDAIPTIMETGVQLLLSIVKALPDIITGIVAALPEIIVGLVTAFAEMQPELIDAGFELFLGLIKALPDIIMATQMAVPQIVQGLFEAFTDPATLAKLGTAGTEMIHGLWEGIKSTGEWLWNKVSGFFDGLVGGIKDFFGIHSPSTLFAGFGKFMVQGLEQGLSAPNQLGSIMSSLSQQVGNGFDGSLSVNARSSVASQNGAGLVGAQTAQLGAPQVNQTIYMLPEQDPRIAGRQFGREFALSMGGSSR